MKKRIHYSVAVCVGCALLLFCTSGLSVNTFTIYQPYILKLNNFTNAQSSMIITVRNLFSFGALLAVRYYYKLFSKRYGMALAGLFIAAGFVLFGTAGSFGAYCAAAAITGLGYGFGTMVPITMLLSEWFSAKRNTAIAACSAVTGLSTLGIPSVLAASVEKIGMKYTFFIEAAVIAVIILIAFLLIRDHPSDKGLEPYGEGTVSAKSGVCETGLTAGDMLLLIPALILIGAVMNVSYSHLTVHMTKEGFSSAVSAVAVAVSGIVLTVSKIIYGRLGDRFSSYACNYVFACLLIPGLLLFRFISKGTPLLFAATALYSSGLSFMAVGLSVWANELSSDKDRQRNIQLFQVLYSAGSLMFSPVPGIMADNSGGSYLPAFLMFLCFAVYVVFAVQFSYVRVRKRRLK